MRSALLVPRGHVSRSGQTRHQEAPKHRCERSGLGFRPASRHKGFVNGQETTSPAACFCLETRVNMADPALTSNPRPPAPPSTRTELPSTWTFSVGPVAGVSRSAHEAALRQPAGAFKQ